MRSLSITFLFLLSVLCASTAEAFRDRYLCTSKYETAAGYAVDRKRPETISGIAATVRNKASVRLFGIGTVDSFYLGEGGKAPLVELSKTKTIIWYAEQADAGTVIIWTLFEGENTRPVTLITTKSYDLFGPVSFTAVYSCQ